MHPHMYFYLQVDRLVDQIVSSIQTYDLLGLRELWAHLDRRIFARLPHTLLPCELVAV